MGYIESRDWVLSQTDYEKSGYSAAAGNWDLRRMEQLMDRLGNPHWQARSVHIAGTKGKGSISALIASALRYCGYNVGLYTSPHLHTIRERIRLNDKLIPTEDFDLLVQKVRPVVEDMNETKEHGIITTFEVLTAMAFLYFRDKKTEFQVLEVGLGGRLDATNVVEAEVSVISSISLDHMELLGNSIEEISVEKGGIIKRGGIVVLSPQPRGSDGGKSPAEGILAEICLEKGAKLVWVKDEMSWNMLEQDLRAQDLIFKSPKGSYNISLPLLGSHQRENAATALVALESLNLISYPSGDCPNAGFSRVTWPGRLQVLKDKPLLIADGAHNADSMCRLKESIKESFASYNPEYLIFGASQDKDIPEMLKIIGSVFPEIILVRSQHPRSASLAYMQNIINEAGLIAQTSPGMRQALEKATASLGEKDLVLVTGSLFVVAEAIAYMGKMPPGYEY